MQAFLFSGDYDLLRFVHGRARFSKNYRWVEWGILAYFFSREGNIFGLFSFRGFDFSTAEGYFGLLIFFRREEIPLAFSWGGGFTFARGIFY